MNYTSTFKKFIVLMFGLFLCSVGILLTVHSRLGAAPWESFQLGLAATTRLTLGQASQLVGATIIIIDIVIKQIPGFGTLLNMYFIGYFIDMIEKIVMIPLVENLYARVLMLLVGVLLSSWGTYFYLDAGWGAGPRDGLMLGLSKRLSTKVWKTRMAIEVCVVIAGCVLGSMPGVGTILVAILIGPAVQFAYSINKKDPKGIKHRTLVDNYHLFASFKNKSSFNNF